MWMMVMSAFALGFLVGIAYLTVAVARFGLIKRMAGKRKFLGYVISFLILAALTVLAGFVFSAINAVIIGLHFVFFFLLFNALGKIFGKRIPKTKVYWQGWLAVLTSVIYLVAGYFFGNHVWQKDYVLQTKKQVGVIRIAMIADIHLGTTFDAEGFEKHLRTIQGQDPDLLLIAGDFVDDSTKRDDFEKACEALGRMNLRHGIWYAYGNHDPGYYGGRDFNKKDIRQILEKNGVRVLEDEYVLVDDRYYVAGRRDCYDSQRKDINEFLSGIDESKYVIVINHEPNDYEREVTSAADLVVSGHTHGGQLVPWTILSRIVRVDDLVYGHVRRGNVDFIVTSGISDWEIPFKTGTWSEYVIITVEGN